MLCMVMLLVFYRSNMALVAYSNSYCIATVKTRVLGNFR